MEKFDNYINITAPLNAATTKGKLVDAKQVYLNGDTKNLQQAYEETSTHFNTLDNRSTQMENAIQDISVTGGASTATAVSYKNETSGMTAVTAQGAIDELVAKNKSQDVIIADKANMSDVTIKFIQESKRIDSELAKKANTKDISAQMNTEQSRVNTELAKKFNSENITQESGEAENKVMSQKAVSNELKSLSNSLTGTLTGLTGATDMDIISILTFTAGYINENGVINSTGAWKNIVNTIVDVTGYKSISITLSSIPSYSTKTYYLNIDGTVIIGDNTISANIDLSLYNNAKKITLYINKNVNDTDAHILVTKTGIIETINEEINSLNSSIEKLPFTKKLGRNKVNLNQYENVVLSSVIKQPNTFFTLSTDLSHLEVGKKYSLNVWFTDGTMIDKTAGVFKFIGSESNSEFRAQNNLHSEDVTSVSMRINAASYDTLKDKTIKGIAVYCVENIGIQQYDWTDYDRYTEIDVIPDIETLKADVKTDALVLLNEGLSGTYDNFTHCEDSETIVGHKSISNEIFESNGANTLKIENGYLTTVNTSGANYFFSEKNYEHCDYMFAKFKLTNKGGTGTKATLTLLCTQPNSTDLHHMLHIVFSRSSVWCSIIDSEDMTATELYSLEGSRNFNAVDYDKEYEIGWYLDRIKNMLHVYKPDGTKLTFKDSRLTSLIPFGHPCWEIFPYAESPYNILVREIAAGTIKNTELAFRCYDKIKNLIG